MTHSTYAKARSTATVPPAAAPTDGHRMIIPSPPPQRAPTAKTPIMSRPKSNPPEVINQESNPAPIHHTVTAANIRRIEN